MFVSPNTHTFHLVKPSAWPLLSSFAALFFVSGTAFYMHQVPYGGFFMIFGFLCVAYCVFFWFYDIVDEATRSGYHTMAVCNGLRLGFILFVVSEIMLFFGFFWAFFHTSICPDMEVAYRVPPIGIEPISAFDVPLFNTCLLIFSGFSITWAHRAVNGGWMVEAIKSMILTILLGLIFVVLQMYEYYEAGFSFSDGVYASSFYMLTGLHGCHVFVGVSFLIICFIRLLSRHFTTTHHLGLLFAIWYWHFVDAVWIFLFLSVYCWGGW